MTFITRSSFRGLRVKRTDHTSALNTSTGGNIWTTVTGTEIYYTPENNASSVIFETCFYGEADDSCFYQARLVYSLDGASWTQVSDRVNPNGGVYGGSQYNRFLFTFQFVIPTWTGERQLRLEMASNSSGQDIQLHKMNEWDGATNAKYFPTTVMIYSV